MIVVDTNIVAYLLIEGEFTSIVEKVYQQDSDWIVPYLWRSELRNILTLYLRKKFISINEAINIVSQGELLLSGKECEVESASVLKLVEISGLSAYDCEFVALAQSLSILLVTSDRKIIKAFPEYGIHPEHYGFSSS